MLKKILVLSLLMVVVAMSACGGGPTSDSSLAGRADQRRYCYSMKTESDCRDAAQSYCVWSSHYAGLMPNNCILYYPND